MINEFFVRFDTPIKILLLLGMLMISGFLVFGQSKSRLDFPTVIKEQPFQLIDKCGEECELKIHEIVSQAIATLSGKPVQKAQTVTQQNLPVARLPDGQSRQVEYFPVGGSGSTTQRDWADLQNTDFYLDIGEYGKTGEVRWTANLKVKHGNGEAFARLFDVTHGIGVQGSDISAKSENFTLAESGLITFLSGKNRYRVQVKSLTGYEAFFDSGKIKIVSE